MALNLTNSKKSTGTNTSKASALDLALSTIEKQFGKEAIMKMEPGEIKKIPVISTGCEGVDDALGVKGVPVGRIIEIYGPESSGKTTLTLHVAAECQKAGGTVAFVDAEHALDVQYASNLGVNVPEMLISQPDSGEQALDIVETLAKSGGVDLIIVDSVAALTPRAELEGDMGASHMGLQARLMSQALRKLTGVVQKTNTTIIFINQLRMKIGVMFGNPETTTGGNALKFYASVRMDIRRIGAIKDGDNVVGNKTKVKVVKNKVAPPFKEVEFDIMYGEGIDNVGSLLDMAEAKGVIEKAGAWYSYNGGKIGQGRNNAKAFLKENPEVLVEVKSLLKGDKPALVEAQAADSTEPVADVLNDEELVASGPEAETKKKGRGKNKKTA